MRLLSAGAADRLGRHGLASASQATSDRDDQRHAEDEIPKSSKVLNRFNFLVKDPFIFCSAQYIILRTYSVVPFQCAKRAGRCFDDIFSRRQGVSVTLVKFNL